jgi:phosphoribosylanthranilate isomerase
VSRTRIKFCGIRRAVDAAAAIDLGVDALGLVMVPASKRFLAPERGAALRAKLPPLVSTVALFMDADAGFVQLCIDAVRPELLQFHGSESAEFCASFGLPYIKAVAMGAGADLRAQARRYRHASALLLDSHAPGAMGGSGKPFDWAHAATVNKPLVLAGGLTPQNVGRGIRQLQPYAVDVSSGIESRPGVKDPAKMQAFVAAVRRADAGIRSRDR